MASVTQTPPGQWKVQNRYGWGWSVYSPDGVPGFILEVSNPEGAKAYCEARNSGKTGEEAWLALRATGALTRDEWESR